MCTMTCHLAYLPGRCFKIACEAVLQVQDRMLTRRTTKRRWLEIAEAREKLLEAQGRLLLKRDRLGKVEALLRR